MGCRPLDNWECAQGFRRALAGSQEFRRLHGSEGTEGLWTEGSGRLWRDPDETKRRQSAAEGSGRPWMTPS
eukprot:6169781-Alexandrium_andersonii.AAC.1